MCLAVYAKKSGIEQEELEEIAFSLVDKMEELTDKEDNHFTRADVLAALEMYNDSYIRFPIDSITKLTQIPIEKNKRNGRKQEVHLKMARMTKQFMKENDEVVIEGRPSKAYEVFSWKYSNPNGTVKECVAETGLSKTTVYKYWNCSQEEQKELIKKQLDNQILRRDKRLSK